MYNFWFKDLKPNFLMIYFKIMVAIIAHYFFSFPLEEFIYNYLITLSFYIIPKKGV